MDGAGLLLLRRDLGLTQDEARQAAGVVNRGFMVEIERSRVKLADEEYARMAEAYRTYAKSKRERKEVMA